MEEKEFAYTRIQNIHKQKYEVDEDVDEKLFAEEVIIFLLAVFCQLFSSKLVSFYEIQGIFNAYEELVQQILLLKCVRAYDQNLFCLPKYLSKNFMNCIC